MCFRRNSYAQQQIGPVITEGHFVLCQRLGILIEQALGHLGAGELLHEHGGSIDGVERHFGVGAALEACRGLGLHAQGPGGASDLCGLEVGTLEEDGGGGLPHFALAAAHDARDGDSHLAIGEAFRADIAAVRLDTIETQPVYDPVSQLVYASGREQVTDVWVAGQHLLKERRLTTLDGEDILERARDWQNRIST